jgi:hypothetical protein
MLGIDDLGGDLGAFLGPERLDDGMWIKGWA